MTEAVQRVADALTDRALHLVVAESCTGGLLAARLTDLPGASRYFEAGLVTYSNRSKEALLGVSSRTLAEEGAVSEGTARAMVEGALGEADGRAAIAITGIAGPDGGSPEKPVGTVYIGVGVRADRGTRVEVRRFRFEGDRTAIREASVRASLERLEALLGEAA